jgi:hypothetical protein
MTMHKLENASGRINLIIVALVQRFVSGRDFAPRPVGEGTEVLGASNARDRNH